jgi:hypothetical protein
MYLQVSKVLALEVGQKWGSLTPNWAVQVISPAGGCKIPGAGHWACWGVGEPLVGDWRVVNVLKDYGVHYLPETFNCLEVCDRCLTPEK